MKQKLKIVHIEDRFHPLMGYQINFLAKYHSNNFDFHIVTSNSLSIWQKENEQINIKELDTNFEKKYNIKIHRLDSLWGKSQKSNLWLKGLLLKIDLINPDIIFSHVIESYSSFRLMLNIYFRRKKVLFLTDTHTLYNQFNSSLKFKIHQHFIKIVLKKIVIKKEITVFATANENKDILLNNYKIPNNNVQYLPIGTDISQFFFSESDRISLRNDFNIKSDDVVLIYTGKINERKEPHLILDAIKIIGNSLKTKLYILFIGSKIEPYYSNKFKLDYFNNKKEIQINFIHSINNSSLYKYYSMADFAVFPRENTLSALDAQACNLPVIMESNITNIERLKKGGLVYQKNNMQDLAEQILTLINNAKLRKQLAINGKKYIEERYDYINIIRNYENYIIKDKFK